MHLFLNGVSEQIEKQLSAYLVYKDTSTPVICRICGGSNKWTPEGLVWVCEHIDLDIPIRNLDHILNTMVEIKEII